MRKANRLKFTILYLPFTTCPVEFEINEEIQDILRPLQGPIGVVSVAGMYRTGKSYLLNRMLLNRSGGFGVGPTINPCTKVSLQRPVI